MAFIEKNSESIYTVNFYDTTISLNAFITFISGLIIATVMILSNKINAAIIIVFTSLFGAYQINCLEFGKCTLLASGMTAIYVLYALAVIYLFYTKNN